MELTQDLVKSVFDYKDGLLYNKTKRKKALIGQRSGYINNHRNKVKVMGKAQSCSRIIFLWHHGYMPDMVDHIDRNKLNDKIENLRAATRSNNGRNRTSAKGSSSQYLGVHFFKNTGTWLANIRSNKKLKHLGLFKNEIDAAMAYDNAAK